MKQSMIAIFALLASASSSFADGSPDQDPVVQNLRERFTTAKKPTLAQLKLDQSWDCREFDAFKDDFQYHDLFDGLRLVKFDGMFMNLGKSRILHLVLAKDSLTGLINGYPNAVFFRATAEGDLIGENTVRAGDPNGSPAVSRGGLLAVSYLVCPVDQVHSSEN